MGARRRGREAALQMLYSIDVAASHVADVIRDYWPHLASSVEGREFANEIVRGVTDHHEAIDDTIRSVSEHWRLERMPLVDRNILRLGAYELLHLPAVPRRVTLNEAVELAKRYAGEGSPAFVNGVLDRIANEADKR